MNKKIIVCGDLHGYWQAINMLINKKQPDIILPCGDFGWFPNFEVKKPVLYNNQVKWLLKGIKTNNTKIYWCDGNHEKHDELPQDGEIHEMYKNVYYCSRGSKLVLPDGRTVLFAGGASSTDKDLRTPGHDWFHEENINYEQGDRILSLENIDIVISHTCPQDFKILKDSHQEKQNDVNRLILNEALKKYSPKLWYFGHWHKEICGEYINKVNNKKTKYFCLDYPTHGSGKWWRYLD